MKLYTRTVTERKPINKFGRLGFVEVLEAVRTDDITPFNKGKKIRFRETSEDLHQHFGDVDLMKADTVYKADLEVRSRHAARRWR